MSKEFTHFYISDPIPNIGRCYAVSYTKVPDKRDSDLPIHVMWFLSALDDGKETISKHVFVHINYAEKEFIKPDFIGANLLAWAEGKVTDHYATLERASNFALELDFDEVQDTVLFRSLYENIDGGEYLNIFNEHEHFSDYSKLPRVLSAPKVLFKRV